MKITVTYQQEDIVKLIKQDLKNRGLKQTEGTEIKYTGIKPVVIAVDSDEPESKPMEVFDIRLPDMPGVVFNSAPQEDPPDTTLEEVLAQAEKLKVSPRERRLRSNEHDTFPEDKKNK